MTGTFHPRHTVLKIAADRSMQPYTVNPTNTLRCSLSKSQFSLISWVRGTIALELSQNGAFSALGQPLYEKSRTAQIPYLSRLRTP